MYEMCIVSSRVSLSISLRVRRVRSQYQDVRAFRFRVVTCECRVEVVNYPLYKVANSILVVLVVLEGHHSVALFVIARQLYGRLRQVHVSANVYHVVVFRRYRGFHVYVFLRLASFLVFYDLYRSLYAILYLFLVFLQANALCRGRGGGRGWGDYTGVSSVFRGGIYGLFWFFVLRVGPPWGYVFPFVVPRLVLFIRWGDNT